MWPDAIRVRSICSQSPRPSPPKTCAPPTTPASARSVKTTCRKPSPRSRALADLRATLEWHFIGPLQSNKTRPVAEQFDWVHSVDRLKIAQRLSEQRPDNLPPLNVCLQVNISGEASKSGVSVPEAVEVAQAIAAPAEAEFARPDGDSRAGRRHRRTTCAASAACANCSSVCVTTDSNSTRCPWACRATSRPPCWKARRSCASAPRSSAREITLTDPCGPFQALSALHGTSFGTS